MERNGIGRDWGNSILGRENSVCKYKYREGRWVFFSGRRVGILGIGRRRGVMGDEVGEIDGLN